MTLLSVRYRDTAKNWERPVSKPGAWTKTFEDFQVSRNQFKTAHENDSMVFSMCELNAFLNVFLSMTFWKMICTLNYLSVSVCMIYVIFSTEWGPSVGLWLPSYSDCCDSITISCWLVIIDLTLRFWRLPDSVCYGNLTTLCRLVIREVTQRH